MNMISVTRSQTHTLSHTHTGVGSLSVPAWPTRDRECQPISAQPSVKLDSIAFLSDFGVCVCMCVTGSHTLILIQNIVLSVKSVGLQNCSHVDSDAVAAANDDDDDADLL